MASSLVFSAARRCLLSPRQYLTVSCVKNIQCSGAVLGSEKRSKAGERFVKECEERTICVLIDDRKCKNLYTPPKFSTNISELFNFFPLSPEIVENTLYDYPELLNFNASKAIEFIKILVECGDYDLITQEEALMFVARVPEILRVETIKFTEQVSNMFGLTAIYDIPWNKVMIAAPHTFTLSPQHVSHVVEHLAQFFSQEKVRDVIGNNPEVLANIWYDTEEKIKYLQKTMNVSSHRIAFTPNSLTHDLEFFKLRYQFLLKSGHYRHPDPSAKAAIPVEASPALHLITDTDDVRFVHKCCPGLSMEEFNVFKSLVMLEDENSIEDEFEVVEEYNDDDYNSNSYTRKVKKSKHSTDSRAKFQNTK